MFMVKKHLCWSLILVFILLLTSACAGAQISPSTYPSTLEPHGPAAARIAELWWVMLALGTAVWLVVVGLMFAALLRRRRGTSATDPDSVGGETGRNWPIFGGIVVPLILIGVTFGYSIYTLAAIENPIEKPPIEIQVIGRRWWWEVKYPDQSVITANEIHLPVGVAAQVKLQTADPQFLDSRAPRKNGFDSHPYQSHYSPSGQGWYLSRRVCGILRSAARSHGVYGRGGKPG